MSFTSIRKILVAMTALTPATAWAASPVIGSSNTAVIEPSLPHPSETPCVVTLFANAVFGGNGINFNYAPPPACPGPWAKVIFTAKIGLDKGIQYDRTGTVFLGGVNLWFGTTAEPTPSVAPHWQIERDVTDDTSLLLTAQTGSVLIANYTNSSDTSVITANGQLLFYPASSASPVPTVPDMVLALNPAGGTVALNDSTSQLSLPLNLPRNVASARLDLYTQSQSGDEFWYSCVPNSLAGAVEDCGGGSFREGEVALDGTPAGVAPVYPWIYTGGLDPYLWSPMPGVQTLTFKPFPVDLTPFVGVLSDGTTHTLAVSVYGANSYFSVAGNLYIYLDHGSSTVTGGLLSDTLRATPSPLITSKTVPKGSNTRTKIDTASSRDFTIKGYAITSAGRVTTTVHETTAFTNDQVFVEGATLYNQQISQDTETLVNVTQQTGRTSTETATQYSYPLTISYVDDIETNGNNRITTGINQGIHTNTVVYANGLPVSVFDLVNTITPVDTLILTPSYSIIRNANQSSSEAYVTQGTGIGCYSRTLTAVGNVLTGDMVNSKCQ